MWVVVVVAVEVVLGESDVGRSRGSGRGDFR